MKFKTENRRENISATINSQIKADLYKYMLENKIDNQSRLIEAMIKKGIELQVKI